MRVDYDVYNIDEILRMMMRDGDWCCTFMQRGSMDVGVLCLKPGDEDPQAPHVNDEIYYVIKGDGFIKIEDKDIPIKDGSVIFVPARARHKFHSNTKELVALYIFAGKDEDLTIMDR